MVYGFGSFDRGRRDSLIARLALGDFLGSRPIIGQQGFFRQSRRVDLASPVEPNLSRPLCFGLGIPQL